MRPTADNHNVPPPFRAVQVCRVQVCVGRAALRAHTAMRLAAGGALASLSAPRQSATHIRQRNAGRRLESVVLSSVMQS